MRKRILDSKQCERIRWYYQHTDLSMAAIARRFGVSPRLVAEVIDRKYVPSDAGTLEPPPSSAM